MPTPQPPLVQVLAAENPAGEISQDRVFTLPNAVLVLDGASEPTPQERDGGWYADTLGRELRARLEQAPGQNLRQLLQDAIAAVASAHSLVPGQAPSSTVSVLRWDQRRVDALVLGDSALLVQTADTLDVLHDTRLDAIATDTRQAIRARLAAGAGYGEEHDGLVRQLVEQEKIHRNVAGGYWIAEAKPEAATHAVVGSWSTARIRHALLMTDGVSRAVTLFKVVPSWRDAFVFVGEDHLDRLLGSVRKAEREDPSGQRWPRTKASDDQAAALLHFHRGRIPWRKRVAAPSRPARL